MATQKFTFKSIINSISLLTLEEVSIVTIALQLLENEEVKRIYHEHFSAQYYVDHLSDTKVTEITTLCKSLQLPDTLLAKVLNCFHWIREQYFDWIYFVLESLPQHKYAFSNKLAFITHVINSVKWSMGAINKEKSVHQLLLFKNVRGDEILSDMFKLASQYCLEDDLKILWEKMSSARKNRIIVFSKDFDHATHYWTCKIRGNVRESIEDISNYLKGHNYLETDMDLKDPNYYALVLYIFNHDISGVKHFNKLAKVGNELKVRIIRKFLGKLNQNNDFQPCSFKELDQCADKVYFLLKEINDESILEKIFQEFFGIFLKIGVKNRLWHKFFFPMLTMCVNSVDQNLFYQLITQLVKDVKMEKVDVWKVKMLWETMIKKVKKSFCLFLTKELEDRYVEEFWKNMTVEVFDMILDDDEFRNILMLYDSRILEWVFTSNYDLIDLWLQKCLVSEEVIISYLENFIHTKSIAVINHFHGYYSLGHVSQFLKWAFKYEDLMDRNKIFKIKDEAMNEILIKLFQNNYRFEDLEDIKKIMDWILRNRNGEYENEFVNWKQKVIEELFSQVPSTFSDGLTHSLWAFLRYGVKDSEKLKIMIRKANLNEGKFCSSRLEYYFDEIDRFLRFLKEYGKDIWLTKKNIFDYIFNHQREPDYEFHNFWINIRKLLYWNYCKNDQERETDVEEIKKTIIKEFGVECTF